MSGSVNYSDLDAHINAFKINFDNIRKLGIENSFKEHLKENAGAIFLHKTYDWADEKEFRILVLNNSDEYLYVPINNSLRGIEVGSKFHRIYYPLLANLHEKGIEFGKIH